MGAPINLDDHLQKRWVTLNKRIQEIGIESYYPGREKVKFFLDNSVYCIYTIVYEK